MNKIKKYFLPMLSGAMITLPTVSALAEGNIDSTSLKKSIKVEDREFNRASKLSEEQISQLKELKTQLDNEEITKEEFQSKLEELGLQRKMGEKFNKIKGKIGSKAINNFKVNLTDDQKTLLQEIKEQVQNGDLTKEEAKAKMEEAGIKLPNRKGHGVKLTEEQKESISELKEQVKSGDITREELFKSLKMQA